MKVVGNVTKKTIYMNNPITKNQNIIKSRNQGARVRKQARTKVSNSVVRGSCERSKTCGVRKSHFIDEIRYWLEIVDESALFSFSSVDLTP